MRVLVVDDDRDLVLSLTALMRTESYDARGLYGAVDIVDHVLDYRPDVVILDIAMPGKNGWQAAAEIRARLPDRRLVLVAISGEYIRGSDRESSRTQGFDFHLMKPCDPQLLLTLLRWVRVESPYRSRLN